MLFKTFYSPSQNSPRKPFMQWHLILLSTMVQVPKFLHESGSQTTVVSMVFCMSSSNKNIVYEKENKMAINDKGNLRTSGISKKRQHLEPAVRRYSWQSVFLKISQHSQENTCVGKHLKACSFIKKSLQHRFFLCTLQNV